MVYQWSRYGDYYILDKSKIYVKYDFILPLYLILDYEYHPILKQMILEDFFIIQDREYDLVKEIKCEDVVVGFCALNFYNDLLIMELCYILPRFRDKGLFVNEIEIIKKEFDKELWLDLPNRFVVESLLKNGFAVRINSFLVETFVPLSFRHPIDEDIRLFTFFYDLRVCGCVDCVNQFISPLLDADICCFDAEKYRKDIVDENYFIRLKDIMFK